MRSDEPHPRTDSGSGRQPLQTESTVTAVGGVALVSITLDNDTAVDLRVRVENDLDGPVLPPRREGVPVAGWDGDRFTGVVRGDDRLGVGYACPVADAGAVASTGSDDDPVSVEILGPADNETANPAQSDSVAAAVRSLGRATPPMDAIPTEATAAVSAPYVEQDRQSDAEAANAGLPQPVSGWLDAVERRVELAERFTDASAAEAAAAIEDCGGIDDAATLPAELDGDIDALRALGERIDDLVSRAAATDPDPIVSSLVAAANDEDLPDRDARSDPAAPSSARPNVEADALHGRRR